MKKIYQLSQLELTERIKSILNENFIFSTHDFIDRSVKILKTCFDLSFEDWQSLINALISLRAARKVQDSVMQAILCHNKSDKPKCALLINIFDEKYVVSFIRKYKHLYNDYVYKSISRGIVFYSEEEARKFAELIANKNNTTIIEHKISSAQNNIYIINAHLNEAENAIFFLDSNDKADVHKAVLDEKNLYTPQRAYKLALASRDKINLVYDYDIAKVIHVNVSEDLSTIEEIPEPNYEKTEAKEIIYIDRLRYEDKIVALISEDYSNYYMIGKNSALTHSIDLNTRNLKKRLATNENFLEEYNNDAGVTDDDVEFIKGYIDGLNTALEIQKSCSTVFTERNVAVVDHFGVLDEFDIPIDDIVQTYQSAKYRIDVDFFKTLDEAIAQETIYDIYYLIHRERATDNEQDLTFAFQKKIYELYKRKLFMIKISQSLKENLLRDLLFVGKDDEEE